MSIRVLVLSASVGGGHLRAAEAVCLAVTESYPDAIVRHVDFLSLANSAFSWLYAKAYMELVMTAPNVLGIMYDWLDTTSRAEKLRLLTERVNISGFSKLLNEFKPDVIVNTHFLPAEFVADLRRRGKITTPQVTVTTDFATHRLWVNTPTDHYTTAATGGAVYLQHMGVQSDITPCGIPIHPAFSKPIDRNIVYKTFDLVEDERPIILQLAGGYGVGPVNSIYRQLLSLNTPSQIIVVTGKNAKLRAELKEITIPFHHKVHILGFTDFMHHLMSVASVVISKPGGLTSSEVLASGTPLLITNPIPGQETRNSDYLLEEGVAVKAESSHLIPMKLEALLHSPTRLALMRERAKLIAKPRAAFDVADIAMKLRSKA